MGDKCERLPWLTTDHLKIFRETDLRYFLLCYSTHSLVLNTGELRLYFCVVQEQSTCACMCSQANFTVFETNAMESL